MKKINRFLTLSLLMTMLFSMAITADAEGAAAARDDIVVLFSSDVHCAVDDHIGYAGLAAYRAEMAQTTDYVTLIDDGDAIQGGSIGTMSHGSYPIDIMNEMGYDMAVPGEHEFDYGTDNFLSLAKSLKCGYTCCNFMNLKTGKPVFDAYKMITYGNTRVAYVGIDTPETFSKHTAKYFQDADGNALYGFCEGNKGADLYQAVQNAVDDAKAAGANYVIACGHCGVDEQSKPWRSTDIIANVSGLSAFIDGYSHTAIDSQMVRDQDGNHVLLTSCGARLENIGKLVIQADGTIKNELISADDYTKKAPAVEAFIKKIQTQNQVLLDRVAATSTANLTTLRADGITRAVQREETNLGDLTADAYRAVGDADIGWVDGEGIHTDIAAGDVTYGDLISVFPSNNALCVMKVTGQQILDALEMAARSCPDENGGFLQVSGLTYTIDATTKSTVTTDNQGKFTGVAGTRRVKNVTVGGKALVATQTYKLASYDGLLKNGGHGMTMFQDDPVLVDGTMLDNEVLIQYVTANLHGVIPGDYAASKGRITILSTPFRDVSGDAWYYPGVTYTYEHNIFSGITATAFAPAMTMTRSQMVAVLWRMAGSPEAAATAAFSDVASDAYYAAAVSWAVEQGITTGVTAATFEPMAPVSRQQFATFLYRYAAIMKYDTTQGGMAIQEYADYHHIASYAAAAMGWANAAGLIQGSVNAANGNRYIHPYGTATRAQVAVILMRFSQNVVEPAQAKTSN
jgi:2',3'-cyclic-nucleotide 2'-phosphodiesterase (5'-nucleotidase family)